MKKVVILLMVAAFVCVSVMPAFAGVKEDAKTAGRTAVNYPANVTKDAVNTVGYAADGTVKTAVSPIKAFWRSLIGKGKPQEIVTDPVNTGGKTIKDATVNTATLPIEAGKQTAEQNRAAQNK